MIREKLNEDLGFAGNSPTSSVIHNLQQGGGKLSIPANRVIIRPPSKEEIRKADLNPSDYQIAQLRVLSKVLFDFGLVSRVYRSKKASLSKDNHQQVEKYKKIFRTFVQDFNENEPIANVRNILALVQDDTFTGNEIINVLQATKNWSSEDELLMNLASMYKSINGYNQTDDEPSEADIAKVRSLYNELSRVIDAESKAGHNESQIKKTLTHASAINNIMKEDLMSNAIKLVYQDNTIRTIADLDVDIDEYLTSNITEGKSVHANTALHEEAAKNLNELSKKIAQDGFKGGLTTTNFFDYMKANEPQVIDYVSEVYGISKEDLSGERFPSWEALAQWFYSPDNLRKIEVDQLNVENRSRSKGDTRKGVYLAVDAKTVAARKKSLEKQIAKKQAKDASASISLEDKLELKQKEYQEALLIRDNIKNDLQEAERLEDKETIRELTASYGEARALAFKIGKGVAALKHAIKKVGTAKSQEVKKSDIEKLKELEQQEKQLFDKAKKNLEDDADLRDFEDSYNKVQQIKNPWDFDMSEIDYCTMSFVINATNEKTVNFVVSELEKGLKMFNEYINVGAYDPEYPDLVGTQIVVDYPHDSKLFKLLRKKPDFAYQMMDSIVTTVRNRLHINISYYEDERYIKINEEF